MSVVSRSTLIVRGRLAMRERRLAAAREGRHGLKVMSFEQAAMRLPGDFAGAIDDKSLRTAIKKVLSTTSVGELEKHQDSSRDGSMRRLTLCTSVGAPVLTLRHVHPTIRDSQRSLGSRHRFWSSSLQA
jgi:hypothetical protein